MCHSVKFHKIMIAVHQEEQFPSYCTNSSYMRLFVYMCSFRQNCYSNRHNLCSSKWNWYNSTVTAKMASGVLIDDTGDFQFTTLLIGSRLNWCTNKQNQCTSFIYNMLSPLTFFYKLFVSQGKVLSHGAHCYYHNNINSTAINIVMIMTMGGWLHGGL